MQHVVHIRPQRRGQLAPDAHLLMLLIGSHSGTEGLERLLLLPGGQTAELFLQFPLFPAQSAELPGPAVSDVEGRHPIVLGVQQVQRGGGVPEGNALQLQHGLDLVEQRQHLIAFQQESLDLEQLDLVEGGLQAFQRGGTDVFHRHEHQQQLVQGLLAVLVLFQSPAQPVCFGLHLGQVTDGSPRAPVCFSTVHRLGLQNGQHPLDVGQLALQLGLLTGFKGFQLPHPLLAVGRAGLQGVQNVLEADIFTLCKRQIDHFASSITLMTGRPTRAFIRSISSSFEK